MPKDYNLNASPPHAQRLPEYTQDDAWIRRFLTQAHIGYVATRWETQPFITPTTFWYDPRQHALLFHSNIAGRVRANSDRCPEACFASAGWGRLLPANTALEFSLQYESVIAFGRVRVLEGVDEKRHGLEGLIRKYFPHLEAGREYRPITDQELARTSVYALQVEAWSGKRNWPERAEQSGEWPPLPEHLFQ